MCRTLDTAPVRSWQVLLLWLGGRPGPRWSPSPRWPGQGRFRQLSSATAVSRWLLAAEAACLGVGAGPWRRRQFVQPVSSQDSVCAASWKVALATASPGASPEAQDTRQTRTRCLGGPKFLGQCCSRPPRAAAVFTSGPGHTGLQEQEQLPCHPSRSLRALDPRGTGLMSPVQDTPLPSPSPKLCPCRPGRAMGSTVPAHRKGCSTHPCRAAPLSSLQRERGPAVTPRGDQSGGVRVVGTWVRSAQTRVCGLQRLPALHAWENP